LEVNILLFVFGIFLGLLSGLIPGIHSNTIVAVLSSLGIASNDLASMIIALFPAHLVAAFIPSIFFGIPEEGTVLSVLAGHRLVLQGKGIAALKTVLLSCAFAAIICTAFFQPSMLAYSFIYEAIKEYIKWILLAIVVLLIARSKNPALSALIFILCGLLGQYSLKSDMQDPFLPLFSGLFAMGAILTYTSGKVPEQKDEPADTGILKWTVIGVVLGMLAHLLPGTGSPSQVATFITMLVPLGTTAFLAAVSSIAMSQGIFSLSSAASIGKSRMGAMEVLSQTIDVNQNIFTLLVLLLLSVAICVAILYFLRKIICKAANIDFSKANIILAVYLFAITALICGIFGIAVFLLASALGWLTIKLGVERTNMMGAIIVPTLLLLFGFY
jgi:putative membrane protein